MLKPTITTKMIKTRSNVHLSFSYNRAHWSGNGATAPLSLLPLRPSSSSLREPRRSAPILTPCSAVSEHFAAARVPAGERKAEAALRVPTGEREREDRTGQEGARGEGLDPILSSRAAHGRKKKAHIWWKKTRIRWKKAQPSSLVKAHWKLICLIDD